MRLLIFLSLILSYGLASADSCHKVDKGDICRVDIADLHPTQFNVGEREVRSRAARFRKMSQKKLNKYIEHNPAPVVLGPADAVYIIDRHHMARALNDAGVDKISATLLEDFSNLKTGEFWDRMIAKGWVLLEDRGVGGQRPDDLPSKVEEMTDDPYRSLAWSVNAQGGYQDTDIPYADFHWADFFRTRIDLSGDYSAAVKTALALAHSPEARGLPGYTSEAVRNLDPLGK